MLSDVSDSWGHEIKTEQNVNSCRHEQTAGQLGNRKNMPKTKEPILFLKLKIGIGAYEVPLWMYVY